MTESSIDISIESSFDSSTGLTRRYGVRPPEEWEYDEIEDLIGTVLGGRYRLIEIMGAGGVGVIVKAIQSGLEREVVVKLLRPARASRERAKMRLEREAQRLCALKHPNVVTVLDFDYHDQLAYLVLEHLDGTPLSRFLTDTGPLALGSFLPIAGDVLRGLSAAHDAGVIHRDIKPGNIMLTASHGMIQSAKLIDFGLARLIEDPERLTRTMEMVGTVSAVTPEQVLGHDTDLRGDIYAFGVLAYEMLCGEKPFEGEAVQVFYHHVHTEPPPLWERLPDGHRVPGKVVKLIHRCLAKDPDERPQNARRALELLRAATKDRGPYSLAEAPIITASGQTLSGRWDDVSVSFDAAMLASEWYERNEARQATDEAAAEQSGELSSQTPLRLSWMTIAGVALVAAGLVLGAWLIARPGGEPAAAAGDGEQVDMLRPEAVSGQNMEEVLARVEQAVDQERLGAASEMLAMLDQSHGGDPETIARVSELRTEVKVARAEMTAERMLANHRLPAAIDAYYEVLRLNPRDQGALERLGELKRSFILKVDANVDAKVTVDGEAVGSTPFVELRRAEPVKVTLTAPGYRPWSTRLSPEGAGKHSIEANLSKPRREPRPQPRPSPSAVQSKPAMESPADFDAPSSIDDDSLMPMDVDLSGEPYLSGD